MHAAEPAGRAAAGESRARCLGLLPLPTHKTPTHAGTQKERPQLRERPSPSPALLCLVLSKQRPQRYVERQRLPDVFRRHALNLLSFGAKQSTNAMLPSNHTTTATAGEGNALSTAQSKANKPKQAKRIGRVCFLVFMLVFCDCCRRFLVCPMCFKCDYVFPFCNTAEPAGGTSDIVPCLRRAKDKPVSSRCFPARFSVRP